MIVFTAIGVIATIAAVGYALLIVWSLATVRESSGCEHCERAGYRWTGYGDLAYDGTHGYAWQGWLWRAWHRNVRNRTYRHRIAFQEWIDSLPSRPRWISEEQVRKYGVSK